MKMVQDVYGGGAKGAQPDVSGALAGAADARMPAPIAERKLLPDPAELLGGAGLLKPP